MKNLSLFLLAVPAIVFFLLPHSVKAQKTFLENTFEAVYFSADQHASPVTNGWAIPSTHYDCRPDYMILTNKQSGNYKLIPLPDGDMISACTQANANEFICSGMYGKGSDVSNSVRSFILKTDSSGNLRWEVKFAAAEIPGINFISMITKTVSANDGSIYGISPGRYICRIDAKGRKVWVKAFPDIEDIAWTSKGLLGSGQNHIFQLDTSGNIVQDYSFSGSHLFTWLQNGAGDKLYSSNENGDVFTIAANMTLTDSFTFKGFGFSNKKLTAVTFVSDSAMYFGEDDSIASYSLKGTLNWKAGLPKDASITGIAYDGSQIAITGNDGLPFYKTFDKTGNTAPVIRDIAIAGITMVHATVDKIPNSADFMIYADFDIMIKNNGTVMLDSLYLHADGQLSGLPYMCFENVLTPYHNLNIAPGNTVKLRLRIHKYMPAIAFSNTFKLDVTVNAESPDGKIDNDFSNNTTNYTNTVTGIQESMADPFGISVYPNPAHDKIRIENNSDLSSDISVLNATGQTILKIKNQGTASEIDVSRMPQGIYLINISNAGGNMIRKFVKD
jgi:hypothetical protein